MLYIIVASIILLQGNFIYSSEGDRFFSGEAEVTLPNKPFPIELTLFYSETNDNIVLFSDEEGSRTYKRKSEWVNLGARGYSSLLLRGNERLAEAAEYMVRQQYGLYKKVEKGKEVDPLIVEVTDYQLQKEGEDLDSIKVVITRSKDKVLNIDFFLNEVSPSDNFMSAKNFHEF